MAAAEENKNFNLTADKDRCIEWCKQHNLLARSIKCPKQQCDNDLSWTRRSRVPDGYMWRCSKKSCNGEVSIHHNLWFCQGPQRGRDWGGGASAPPLPHFFENYKELLRKSVFSPPPPPPTLSHKSAPPLSK